MDKIPETMHEWQSGWHPLQWGKGAPVRLSTVLPQLVPYLKPIGPAKALAAVSTGMGVSEEDAPMPNPGQLRDYFRGSL